MKIAVMADIHENYHNLLQALAIIQQGGVEQILCLGDLINAGIARLLAEAGVPALSVWGNNDGDKVAIMRVSLSAESGLTMADNTYASLECGGKRVFLTHYDDLARPMARSGDFDVVFYGHDHKKCVERIGDCLVANPGEVSAHKTGQATFALYDSALAELEFVSIPDAVSVRTAYVVESRQSERYLNRSK